MKHKEFVEHIKKHGITLAKTTEDFYEVPKGTKLWFGLSKEGNPTPSNVYTNNKNKEFDYTFSYEWYFTQRYKGEFILVDEPKFKVGDEVRIIKNRRGHNFNIGTLCTIKSSGYNPNWKVEDDTGDHWFVSDEEIEHIQESSPEPHYKQYIGKKYAVHCKTQEEWNRVCEALKDWYYIPSEIFNEFEDICRSLKTQCLFETKEMFSRKFGFIIISVAEFFGEEEKQAVYGAVHNMPKPIKLTKSINIKEKTMETLGTIPKKLKKIFDKDTKALYRTGNIDAELELTSKGRTNLMDVLFDKKADEKKSNKELLADVAREEIKEIEAEKKK